MRRTFLIVPALCLAVVGLAVAGMASPSFAAATTPVVTTYTTIAGAPQQVAVGGTLSFSMTFAEQSSYSLRLIALRFDIQSTCGGCASPHTARDAVTFLDPRSGKWSTAGNFGGAYVLGFYNGTALRSDQQLTVTVRANLSSVPVGSYVIAGGAAIVSNPVDSQGHPISVSWARHDAANRTFSIGAVVTPSTTPSPKPSASKKPSHKPATTGPTSTPSSTPSALTSPSPSVAVVASATPVSSTPVLTDTASTSFDSGFSASTWLIALVPIAVLIGFVFWRYRRPTQPE
jgi:hypothetical protein